MPWPWSSKKEGERSPPVSPNRHDGRSCSPEREGGLSLQQGGEANAEVNYAPSIKEDQIKALMYKIRGMNERKEGSLYDFELTAPDRTGKPFMVAARVFLPRLFPVEKPVVQMMAPVFHPWVNQYMQVDGHPSLVGWKVSSLRLLADILLETMAEFNRATAAASQSRDHWGRQGMADNQSEGVQILSPLGYRSLQSENDQLWEYGYPDMHQCRSYPVSNGPVTRPAPFEHLIRAHSEEQLSHTPIPPIPSEFPELNDKPLSQLNRLIEDDVARMALIKAMPSIVSFCDMKDQLCYENVQTATKNLEKQEELENLRATAAELRDALLNEANEHATLVKELHRCSGISDAKGSNQALLKSVMYMSKECDEKCERMAEALLQSEPTMDTNTFLVHYLGLRKRYHTLAAKAEGLKRSMRMV